MDDNFRNLLIDLTKKVEILSEQLKNKTTTDEFISERCVAFLEFLGY